MAMINTKLRVAFTHLRREIAHPQGKLLKRIGELLKSDHDTPVAILWLITKYTMSVDSQVM